MKKILKNIGRLFELKTADLLGIIDRFHQHMAAGLRREKSSLKMLPAYVGLPSGTEKGRYLVCDMGGTNVRVMSVELNGNRRARVESAMRCPIPLPLRRGEKEALFSFLARVIGDFTSTWPRIPTPFAFTFSYPMEQKSINSGILIRWTKGFNVRGVEGKEVGMLISQSLKGAGLSHIHLRALINDTVATLLYASYQNPAYDMAVILGTGTNACYPERKVNFQSTGRETIINLEWGNFSELPANDYDKLLDVNTPNPGEQRMEKMVSGMYLGELVRLVLLETQGSKGHPKLNKPYGLTARQLVRLEAEEIKAIAHPIVVRSARILAAAITAVITWMDSDLKNIHHVAVDGSLFTGYPGYRKIVEATVEELLPRQGDKLIISPVKSASGIGAAVACAMSDFAAKSF